MQTPFVPPTVRRFNILDCILKNQFVVLSQKKTLKNVNINSWLEKKNLIKFLNFFLKLIFCNIIVHRSALFQ